MDRTWTVLAAAIVGCAAAAASAALLALGGGTPTAGAAVSGSADPPSILQLTREQRAINRRLKAAILRSNAANKGVEENKRAIASLTSGRAVGVLGTGTAQGAAGPQGPAGPEGPAGQEGPAGSDATVNGVSAGGSLSGTYPNPGIANGAVGPGQLGAVPAVDIGQGAVQSIPSSTTTAVAWSENGADHDPLDMHSNGTNPSRLTAPRDGLYLAQSSVLFAASTEGIRQIGFRRVVSGVAQPVTLAAMVDSTGSTATPLLHAGKLVRLSSGDAVEVVVAHSRPTPLDATPFFVTLVWTGPLS